jgi:membrane associated rhomboid family serine protease
MFPLRDDNPHFLVPIACRALISINAAVWVLVQGLGSETALASSVCTLGLIPGELLGTLPAGTSFQVSATAVCTLTSDPAWHTVVTSMFLHGGWLHILGNLWFLHVFGNNVEDAMGHARFVAFYLLCGIAAAAAQVLSDPSSGVPMVGASGAIGGVMGAYVVLYPRVHVHMLLVLGFYVTTVAVPAVLMLGYWFLVQLVGGFGSLGAQGGGVAFWAHVGGFGSGALLVFPFRNRDLLRRHPFHGWQRRELPTRTFRRVR